MERDPRHLEPYWREETNYAVTQPNGQPLALFSPEGERTWRQGQHSLWGLRLTSHWSNSQTNPLDPNLLFAGQYYDEESQLAYNRFRYYDPETGSYLTSDPIGLAGGEQPYRYTQNPLNYIDPWGLATCPIITRDSLGRIASAEAKVTKEMIGTGTAVNKTARDYAKSLGLPTDDAGHILAKILGGQGGKGNVFPQLKGVNRGQYREFEKSVRKMLEKYGDLDLKWKFNYPQGLTRPSEVIYDVFHKGSLLDTLTFLN